MASHRTCITLLTAAALRAVYGGAVPDLAVLASAPQPVDTATYGAPSVANAWGSVLASTTNVLGFNAFTMAPFSQGWLSPRDAAWLTVGGMNVPPSWSTWSPFAVRRNGSVSIPGAGAVSVASELRMVFEAPALLLVANIHVDGGAAITSVPVTVDIATHTRYYPRADQCTGFWHYPTHSIPCCWNWFPPQPSSTDEFVYGWTQTGDIELCSIADTLSRAVGAYAITTNLTVQPMCAGSACTWNVTVPPAGASFSLRFAYVVTNTTSGDAEAAAQALAENFDAAFVQAQTDTQARFEQAFTSSNGHFSGSLPVLSENGTVDPATGLTAMQRIYYHSVASFLANERTNLPVSLSGDPCSPSISTQPAQRRCSNTVPMDLRTRRSGGLFRYLAAYAEKRGLSEECWPDIAGTGYSGERVYVTGGGLNSTTNVFYWDNSYSPVALSLLDPEFVQLQVPRWMGSFDPDSGIPSFWSFWGYDYASQRGIGNYYAANDFTLFTLVREYVAVTGDAGFLLQQIQQAYPNGTIVSNTTVQGVLQMLANHWRDMNASKYLADYGGAPNLLECVPTYIHRVAATNAANAWMMNELANLFDMLAAARNSFGDQEYSSTQLRSDADAVAAAVINQLYVPPNGSANSGGYFLAQYLNGTSQGVRHVMDYVYVSEYLGVNRTTRTGPSSRNYLPPDVAGNMTAFVKRELLVPEWMRALSLLDPAAPLSNRSDHGPSGAYVGWPPLTMAAMGAGGLYTDALAFLHDTLFDTLLGAYGQAIEIRPPGTPYKPMLFTLYNEAVALSFANVIISTFFGFQPGLNGTETPVVDAAIPRGFNGTLTGLVWHGKSFSIVSNDSGVYIE